MASSKKKILIIEDEEELRLLYQLKLHECGFDVEVASDGEEGLRKTIALKPDLILLDLIMPRKNGFAFLEDMKKNKSIKDTPVVILTNLCQSEDIELAKSLGAKDFVVKAEVLISKLADIVLKNLAPDPGKTSGLAS